MDGVKDRRENSTHPHTNTVCGGYKDIWSDWGSDSQSLDYKSNMQPTVLPGPCQSFGNF